MKSYIKAAILMWEKAGSAELLNPQRVRLLNTQTKLRLSLGKVRLIPEQLLLTNIRVCASMAALIIELLEIVIPTIKFGVLEEIIIEVVIDPIIVMEEELGETHDGRWF